MSFPKCLVLMRETFEGVLTIVSKGDWGMRMNLNIYKDDDKALQELWEAAHLDSLTRLYSRHGMETWIEGQLDSMGPDDVATMLMLDVDNFKIINDTYGHMLGDALLIDIADSIRTLFTDEFFCGRIGGDEYQIFSINVSEDIIRNKANQLCQDICVKYQQNHQQYDVTISIGIAQSDKQRGRTYSDLYKMADMALYQAKSGGKNGVSSYDGSMQMQEPAERITVRHEEVVQLGDSGFSSSKILLDGVIEELYQHHDPRTTIEHVSKLIVEAFDVTRAYASCYTPDESHIGKSYFYAQNDDPNITPNLAISGREYEKTCFNSDSIFFCTDIEKTPEPIRTELKRMQVETLLQVLIHRDGKIIGTLGINNCGYKRLWLKDEIETIHTIGKLLNDTIYDLQQSCVPN